jgi:hypothetical protein
MYHGREILGMDVTEKAVTLPPSYAMDYEALLSTARAESGTNIALFLREHLPFKWRDLYVASVAHRTNIVRFQCRTFEFFYDLHSELEATGEVSFDQTIQNRVVAVLGTSTRADEPRDASRSWDWVDPTEEFLETERDKGHYMAHCIGGGLDVNVFSQERRLNRGRSPQGRIYRQMETYCYEHPGTFCFSRPVYADGSSVPRWLEFGLLKPDDTLWVETFDN